MKVEVVTAKNSIARAIDVQTNWFLQNRRWLQLVQTVVIENQRHHLRFLTPIRHQRFRNHRKLQTLTRSFRIQKYLRLINHDLPWNPKRRSFILSTTTTAAAPFSPNLSISIQMNLLVSPVSWRLCTILMASWEC